MSLERFIRSASMYCKYTRGSVTSWWRSKQRNKAVGGKDTSAHLEGLAVDVVYDSPIPLDTAVAEARSWDLRVIRESDHDHLQPLSWAPKGAAAGAD